MKIYTSIPLSLPQTALTIGFFDGVHRGHQELLKTLKQQGKHATALTFISPPSTVIRPNLPHSPLLTPWPMKLALLQQSGIDAVILLPFTLEFAATPFDQLLSQFSLSALVLGTGSAFGKNREGNEANIKRFAENRPFSIRYLPKETFEGKAISSSAIRQAIVSGDLQLAAQLLGRPHAVSFPGNETELTIQNLCLPPDGVYSVSADKEKIELTLRTLASGEKRLNLNQPLPNQTLLKF
jgi:riboflavin kinase/FMN adenylyltransferase